LFSKLSYSSFNYSVSNLYLSVSAFIFAIFF
jgi:hypothetical protein